MLLRIWRFLTVMLTALSLSAAVAHLLELPAKIHYEPALWLRLLQTLYPPAFGPVAGLCEIAAVVSVLILAFLVRRRRPAFAWTVAAAACLVVTHGAFWILVAPVNATLLPLTPETLPQNWTFLRDQWEYTHAARAILQIAALAALVASILAETPADLSRRRFI
jgi:hypothetical protein